MNENEEDKEWKWWSIFDVPAAKCKLKGCAAVALLRNL
jgi:hypothetical protein